MKHCKGRLLTTLVPLKILGGDTFRVFDILMFRFQFAAAVDGKDSGCMLYIWPRLPRPAQYALQVYGMVAWIIRLLLGGLGSLHCQKRPS